jgi:excisionase family DNA binding protein
MSSTVLTMVLGEDDVRRIADAVAAKLLVSKLGTRTPPGPARLSVREVAAELRCSERQVRRLIAAGQLNASRFTKGGSSRVMVARASLERLIGGAE